MKTNEVKTYTPEQLADAEKLFDVITALPKDEQCTVAMIANAFMEGMQAQKRLPPQNEGGTAALTPHLENSKREGDSRMSEPRTVRVGTCTPINPAEIPATVGMILAQTLLPDLQRAYADPIIQADYQRWKAERAAKGGEKNAKR